MKVTRLFAVLLIMLVSLQVSHGLESRTWTSGADGRTIIGTLIATKGTQIVIRRDTSGDVTLSPDLLVESDRDYIFDHLPDLESAIRLDKYAVKSEIVWKIGDSENWKDAYKYYEHKDEGCYINEDGQWIFLYDRQKNSATLLRPGISYNNGMRDPFDSTVSQISRLDLHVERAKKALESCLVESQLSTAGGFICRYYKYETIDWKMEVWSVPVKHPIYNSTMAAGIEEIIRKPGYDIFKREGKHASYKRMGVAAQDSPLNIHTRCGGVSFYFGAQSEYPIVLKHVYKEPRKGKIMADVDMLMTNRLVHSSTDSLKLKIASTRDMLENDIHGEIIVGKPGSGFTF